MEGVQTYVGLKMGKLLPKVRTKLFGRKVTDTLIRDAITKPGSKVVNIAKEMTANIASEVPMELGQEYAGQKLMYEIGQSEHDPGWSDISPVIGATVVMSVLLGGAGHVGASSEAKQIRKALSDPAVDPGTRLAAIIKIHDAVEKNDPELAKYWLETTMQQMKEGKPIIFPESDKGFRTKQQDLVDEQELAQPQERVEKLDEALVAQREENARLREEHAKATPETENEAPGDTADNTEKPTENDSVAPETSKPGEPNEDGVIDVDVPKVEKSNAEIEKEIKQLEKLVEENPDHPQADTARNKIEELRGELTPEIENKVSGNTTDNTKKPTQETSADPESSKPEFSKPLDIKKFRRNKDTGYLEFTDKEAGVTVQLAHEKDGWYRVNSEGENTFLGNTKKLAIESLNERTLENSSETKYSVKKEEGDLLVDPENIPDDIDVTTTVVQADTGKASKITMKPKQALSHIESTKKKLDEIIRCVTS